uniref:Putative RNA binding domain protein n=1 Tax=viral metagenome TaxID=1070528 RepID=A0A6H1ZUL6_9ZZZZ
MIGVESSMIEAIGYDPSELKLRVKFKKGGQTFVYLGVSEDVYLGMLETDSIGKYFHSKIKGKYEFSAEVKNDG